MAHGEHAVQGEGGPPHQLVGVLVVGAQALLGLPWWGSFWGNVPFQVPPCYYSKSRLASLPLSWPLSPKPLEPTGLALC